MDKLISIYISSSFLNKSETIRVALDKIHEQYSSMISICVDEDPCVAISSNHGELLNKDIVLLTESPVDAISHWRLNGKPIVLHEEDRFKYPNGFEGLSVYVNDDASDVSDKLVRYMHLCY